MPSELETMKVEMPLFREVFSSGSPSPTRVDIFDIQHARRCVAHGFGPCNIRAAGLHLSNWSQPRRHWYPGYATNTIGTYRSPLVRTRPLKKQWWLVRSTIALVTQSVVNEKLFGWSIQKQWIYSKHGEENHLPQHLGGTVPLQKQTIGLEVAFPIRINKQICHVSWVPCPIFPQLCMFPQIFLSSSGIMPSILANFRRKSSMVHWPDLGWVSLPAFCGRVLI